MSKRYIRKLISRSDKTKTRSTKSRIITYGSETDEDETLSVQSSCTTISDLFREQSDCSYHPSLDRLMVNSVRTDGKTSLSSFGSKLGKLISSANEDKKIPSSIDGILTDVLDTTLLEGEEFLEGDTLFDEKMTTSFGSDSLVNDVNQTCTKDSTMAGENNEEDLCISDSDDFDMMSSTYNTSSKDNGLQHKNNNDERNSRSSGSALTAKLHHTGMDFANLDLDDMLASECDNVNLQKTLSSLDYPIKRRKRRKGKENSVKFDKVHVRMFERILVNNPSCSSGPSLGIGQRYATLDSVDIETWELQKSRKREKNSRRELLLSKSKRVKIAQKIGYSEKDIVANIRAVNKAKSQRLRTVSNLKAQGMEEAVEVAQRKLAKMMNTPCSKDDRAHQYVKHRSVAMNGNCKHRI